MIPYLKQKIFIAIFLMTSIANVFAQQELKLQYLQPAVVWTEALPVGNGRLGAMVFGKVDEELIQLNEASLWSGGPVAKNVNPMAFDYLATTRLALQNGNYAEAYQLTKKMQGLYSESYMPLGDLVLKFGTDKNKATAYHRELNIGNGIATTTYNVDGVMYKREVFASAPGQCIVVRLSASQKQKLSLRIEANSKLRHTAAVLQHRITLNGKAPSHVDPNYVRYNKEPIVYDDLSGCRGMRFGLTVKPIVKDGTVTDQEQGVTIENASEVLLLISAATSFNGFDKCPDSEGLDEKKLVEQYLSKAANKSYDQLLKAHLTDFQGFFNRVSLKLNPKEENSSALPTDQRLDAYTKGKKDAGLEALFFQYGRYLLISSSRTKSAPANLQGIWNKEMRPPWSSNYTTNINLQMNYWPVETANLSELFSPLDDLIKNLYVTGSETAKSFYHARGWVVHHNSDIWATSNPVGDLGKGDPKWANWYMGANWLSRHLWEHYQYTQDKSYLKKVYPMIKQAAVFSLDWLQKDKNGYLVTMPSTSPENNYYYDGKKNGIVTVASTMDMGIIRDVFSNTIEASKVLGLDLNFRDTVAQATKQLFPFKIGSKGQLQEWHEDFEDQDPHHRHTSHLYALHPANFISPLATPDLAKAARQTLEMRGDDGTGWSLAWKVNMWARLLDGNHAYRLFRNQLRLTKENDPNYNKGGGAYPNLFDAHPPFQIDGNFAGTAGVIEMLMQSQNNEIHLLPALPDAWEEGSITGIIAKGNFKVGLNWEKGKLKLASITSNKGGQCTIRSATPFQIHRLGLKSKPSSIGYTVTFDSKKGQVYELVGNGE